MKYPRLALILAAALWVNAHADPVVDAPMSFIPIAASAYGMENDADVATIPWVIPDGYVQSIVSDENRLDLYIGNDRPDMNTVNESGEQAGRYLYRTHEVPGGGALSVVDLKTGVTRKLVGRADWESLDGIVWTPWRSILFAEEAHTSTLPDPAAPDASSGLVYEVTLRPGDPMAAAGVNVRPMLGALAHEGIETDAAGNVYVIDEQRQGSIYRFVPESYGDLSSGRLYALRVRNGARTGEAEWVPLDMKQVQISARVAAAAAGATPFCRPEDLERIGSTLYVALTCEDVDHPAASNGPGAVLAISLGEQPAARYAVAPGKNAPREISPTATARGATGLKNPDNLAKGPDGRLWIAEDNAWSDIWVYDPDSADADGDGYRDGVSLFASLKDRAAEGSGIYFGLDPHTLYVNIQHSGTGNDKTMAITRRR